MNFHEDHHYSPASSFRSIKSAFRRKSASSASSNNSPPLHPPTLRTSPALMPASSGGGSHSGHVSSLAARNYPHVHVKEMVYDCCPRIPKHSYEESVSNCTCGKKVVDRYREMCSLKGVDECPGCKFGFEEERESDYDDY